MAKAVVSIARLVTFQTLTIHRVMLVVLAHTAIKFFKRLMCPANPVLRVPIRPPKGCPTLMGATIVPRVNIQQKKATRNHRNAKPVSSASFKIYRATPRVANAPVDGETA